MTGKIRASFKRTTYRLPMFRFSGADVFLTGAASGIGRATAFRLLQEGAALYAVDQDADGLEELARSAGGQSGRLTTATVDVTDEVAVAAALEQAASPCRGIDAVINAMQADRTAPVVCREALRHLPDHHGVIVNVATAGSVLSFSVNLAAELADRGIRVVAISPDAKATDPEEVAGVIVFAASRDSTYVSGAEIHVDDASHL